MSTIIGLYYLTLFFGSIFLLLTKYRGDWSSEWHKNRLAKPLLAGSLMCLPFLKEFSDIGFFTAIFAPIEAGIGFYILVFFLKSFHIFGMSHVNSGGSANHNRGAKTADVNFINKRLKVEKKSSRLSLGGLNIPTDVEGRNFVLAGSPGSGKSQAITEILDQLVEHPDRVFIADPSGQFLKRYYKKGEVIFNPFDSRSCDWSPLAEMSGVWSADTLAKSIIPDGEGSSAEWNSYAQTLLSSILRALYLSTSSATNGELYRLSCVAPTEELRVVVEGTAAQTICAEGNEKMLGSVRAILSSYVEAIKHLNPETGKNGFSFSKHVIEGKGWVYLTYNQQQLASIRSLIACALDVTSLAILSLEPDLTRQKIWIIADEFPLLGKVQNMEILATNGRKHGAVMVLGFQAQAQLESTYGRLGSTTLLACIGTQVVLRCADQQTARYWADHAGEEEITRTMSSGGTSSNGSSDNWSNQVAKQHIVMASEIQAFADLRGYCKLAGDYPIVPMILSVAHSVPVAAEAFVQVDMSKLHVPVKPAVAQVKPAVAQEEPDFIDL